MDQNIPSIQQESNQSMPADVQVNAGSQYSWKYISLGVVLMLLVGIGAFLFGRRSANNADTAILTSPTPTAITSPPATPSQPVQDQKVLSTYEFTGFKNTREGWIWKPFVMHYPSSWIIDQESKDESSLSFNLMMKRSDGSYFTIVQGFGEGGKCLFPQDSDYETFEGMGVQVTTFVEIQKSGDTWRLAQVKTPNDISSHIICGINPIRNSEFSSGRNVVGISEIKLATDIAYQEFVEILKQIEIK